MSGRKRPIAITPIGRHVNNLFRAHDLLKMNHIIPTSCFELLKVVEETLKTYATELSTFDTYAVKVRSDHLDRSVVHTSETFLIRNSERLNENDYELLKMLISLLYTPTDSTVLCVAAHDLGAYMSRYLRGKTLVENFGGKDTLLKVLHDKDPEVTSRFEKFADFDVE